MISKFHIKNFRSIVDLTIDFSYGEGKAPNGFKEMEPIPFLVAPGKTTRLVPCMAFFGANASGKSNIITAFGVLCNFVTGVPLKKLYHPNVTNPQGVETTFELDFIWNKMVVKYKVSYTEKTISEETLNIGGQPLFSVLNMEGDFCAIESETYPAAKLSEIIRVEASDGNGSQIASVLNCFGTRYKGLNSKLTGIYNYFLDRNLIVFSNDETLPLPMVLDMLSETTDGNKEKAREELVDIVRRLDIDIESIEIESKEMSFESKLKEGTDGLKDVDVVQESSKLRKRFVHTIYSTHKTVTGSTIRRSFFEMESAGTIRMASLAGILLYAVKTGRTIIIDEFDNSLHSRIVKELIGMFKSKRYNTKEAQLFFATHNTDVLDDSILRISEIAIVRKNLHNGTMVRRLVDFRQDGEDIRNVTNFRKQYLEGFYSGIPHPAL